MTEFHFHENNTALILFSFVEFGQRYPGSLAAELVFDGMVRLSLSYQMKEFDVPCVVHIHNRDAPEQHWCLNPGNSFSLEYAMNMGECRELSADQKAMFNEKTTA